MTDEHRSPYVSAHHVGELEAQLSTARAEAERLRTECDRLESERDLERGLVEEAHDTNTRLAAEAEQAKRTLAAAVEAHVDCSSNLRADLAILQAEAETLRKERDEAKKELAEARFDEWWQRVVSEEQRRADAAEAEIKSAWVEIGGPPRPDDDPEVSTLSGATRAVLEFERDSKERACELLEAAESEVAALRAREVALVGALEEVVQRWAGHSAACARFDGGRMGVSYPPEMCTCPSWAKRMRAALSATPTQAAEAVRLAYEALESVRRGDDSMEDVGAALASLAKSFPGAGR